MCSHSSGCPTSTKAVTHEYITSRNMHDHAGPLWAWKWRCTETVNNVNATGWLSEESEAPWACLSSTSKHSMMLQNYRASHSSGLETHFCAPNGLTLVTLHKEHQTPTQNEWMRQLSTTKDGAVCFYRCEIVFCFSATISDRYVGILGLFPLHWHQHKNVVVQWFFWVMTINILWRFN